MRINLNTLIALFLFISLSSCSNKNKKFIIESLNEYDKKIDSFDLLLNTFNDPNLDTMVVLIKNLEEEFQNLIRVNNDNITNLLNKSKIIPKEKKRLKTNFIDLQLKANLLLQKIFYKKEKVIVERLELAKTNLQSAINDFDKFGSTIKDALFEINEGQLLEIDQTISDIKSRSTIKIDSLNRQYLELKAKK